MRKKIVSCLVVMIVGMFCLCGCGSSTSGEIERTSSIEEMENVKIETELGEKKDVSASDPEFNTQIEDFDSIQQMGGISLEVDAVTENRSPSVDVSNIASESNHNQKVSGREASNKRVDSVSESVEETKESLSKDVGQKQSISELTDEEAKTNREDNADVKNTSDSNVNEIVHIHSWIPITETKEVKVIDKEAYEEKVHIADNIVCKKCGQSFGQGESAVEKAGMHNLETGHAYMSRSVYEIVYHEETYHFESEKVVVGYACECGEYIFN